MWNESLQSWINEDKLAVIGIVQEQHAERTRLYKQWKKYEWPIVQDALNLLKVKVVPLAIAIDEQGRVVDHNATPKFISAWLKNPDTPVSDGLLPKHDATLDPVREQLLWKGDPGLNAAIEGYEDLISGSHAEDPAAHFEVAVAYRHRFEATANADDFQKAIDHWSRALALDPNQYIYRRRIEQYGARLGKPYPFYDWVEQAQTEIRDRGEQPVELTVKISGAEIASPIRKFVGDESVVDFEEAGKINADEANLIDVDVIAVPRKVAPGAATRVHVLISPGSNAKWNNAGGQPTMIVLDEVNGATLSKRKIESSIPDREESTEMRRFEFEVQLDKDVTEALTVEGFALFEVCIVDSGQCTYLRKPFSLTIEPLANESKQKNRNGKK